MVCLYFPQIYVFYIEYKEFFRYLYIMKLVITEKQLKLILSNQVINDLDEQEAPVNPEPSAGTSDTQTGGQGYPSVGKWESGATRGPGNQIGVTKWSDVVGSTLQRSKGNQLKEGNDFADMMRGADLKKVEKDNAFFKSLMNSHTFLTVAGVGSYFIPLVGPLLSTGFALRDAQLYRQEGDDRSATISLFFALLPGLKLGKELIAARKLGAPGLKKLGEKIISGSALATPLEKQVLNDVVKYKKVIQSEITKSVKEITINQARKVAQKQIVKQKVKTGIKKGVKTTASVGLGLGKAMIGGELVGQAYDQVAGPRDIVTRGKNEPPSKPDDFPEDSEDENLNPQSSTTSIGGAKPN